MLQPGRSRQLATICSGQAIGGIEELVAIMPDTNLQQIGDPRQARPRWEPAFNLPGFVLGFGALLIVIHAVRTLLLTPLQDAWAIILFGFIPARYGLNAADFPVQSAQMWTPLSYSLLHADWTHLLVNLLWLAAFASPLVRRIGTARAMLLAAIASLGGAGLHFMFFANDDLPVIGASAIVSGCMGAAARFAFQPGKRGGLNIDGPARTLVQSFADKRFLGFLAVWLGLNFLFGSGIVPLAGEERMIAWQAHAGGFLAGVFAFSLLDRR